MGGILSNALLEFLDRYGPPAGEAGPLLFEREVLGVKHDPWQEDGTRAFGRGERAISVRACHGPGKTAWAAWKVPYMLLCRFPQKTVATAPSAAQLKGALVPEVKMWFGRLPMALQDLFEIKAEGIYLKRAPESSYFEARTARAESPEALQGIHSDHVLLIGDEASGIPEPIFVAGVGSMSGHNATTMLLSNPTRTSGFFHRTHNQNKADWYTIHVGAKDSPRVSPQFVEMVRKTWGEDSDEFRVRVLGEFPRSDMNTLIPADFVESARKRDVIVPASATELWGLDVARFGDDACALVRRNKLAVMPTIETWSGKDLMYTVNRVHGTWKDTPSHLRPEAILVDAIGMGEGVVDRLREMKVPVYGINVSETAASSETYRNLRSELWFKCRDWLEIKTHKLPWEDCCGKGHGCIHDRLCEELLIPRYGYTSTGKQLVEPKDSIKSRGYKSPNLADALMLTFAMEISTLLNGSGGGGLSWNEPVRRNLSHV